MVRAFTIEVNCDKCGEVIPVPAGSPGYGSHFWEAEDVRHAVEQGPTPGRVTCDCGKSVKITGPIVRSMLAAA